MSQWISIRSSRLSADIDPLGAQLSALRDAEGRDLLWNGDPSVWSGRAPLLFPIVGALAGGRYRLSGHSYALSRHGFARGKMFKLTGSDPASASFSLSFDDETLRVYPFRFELRARYALEASTLAIEATVRNLGSEELPASFGYHPGFRWPLPYGQPRSEHTIEFAAAEPAPIKRLTGEGLLSDAPHPTPVADRRMILNDDLFRSDVVIFDQLGSRSLSYGAPSGPRIELAFDDAPYLGIWTKPGADFVCLEPWHGIADPQGFNDDFTRKPGVLMIAPGSERTFSMKISLRA